MSLFNKFSNKHMFLTSIRSTILYSYTSPSQHIAVRSLTTILDTKQVGSNELLEERKDLPKKQKLIRENVPKDPLNINVAVEKIKELSWASFDETIEISLNLGLDPRKPNQSVKGIAKLPNGTGKKIRVCVFANGQDAKDALDAGADVVGTDDLIKKIQGGDVNFDAVIASPELMSIVGKIGKILGPRGLMPNPKMGTVTKDIANAVKAAKNGAVQFKVEKRGIIQAGIGKKSFSNESLLENIRAFMVAVFDAKPEGLKGKYLKVAHISSTMGPGLKLELHSVDPSSARFMLQLST